MLPSLPFRLIQILGRIHEYRGANDVCVIGLKPYASIPLLSYDV
jgi:hypothetical protein